jgi:hypothetical protein
MTGTLIYLKKITVESLKRAAEIFQKEFGTNVEIMLINPADMAGLFASELAALPFKVRRYKRARPGVVWACKDDDGDYRSLGVKHE